MRKLLKRGNFLSLDDLRAQILAFIAYYNRTMAKPIKWTYSGLASSWRDFSLSVLVASVHSLWAGVFVSGQSRQAISPCSEACGGYFAHPFARWMTLLLIAAISGSCRFHR